jgi:formamidopyrimidine-DNA glycosylase
MDSGGLLRWVLARMISALRRRTDRPRRHPLPELPDITVYAERIHALASGRVLRHLRIANPFVLRTAVPPIASVEGRALIGVRRLGKRVVLSFEGELHLVIHLMRAGRFRWLAPGAKLPGKAALAAFDFDGGSLVLTEAGTRRRASIHLVEGETALAAFDAGGLEVLENDLAAFAARLHSENHTLKRALTAPNLFSGIGGAYSDEILHRAKLSPLTHSRSLSDAEVERLYIAARAVLGEWTQRLRAETGAGFPEKVTAFREGMAVHGRFGQPCHVCGTPIQRIVYADTETNYCARCQTGGRLLADRALSRLLKQSWPRNLDELE